MRVRRKLVALHHRAHHWANYKAKLNIGTRSVRAVVKQTWRESRVDI